MHHAVWKMGARPDVWGPLLRLAGPYSVKHFYGRQSLQPSHEPSHTVIQAPVLLNGMGKEGQKKAKQNN